MAKEKAESEAGLELENQQKANDQQNAIELENRGNELLAQGEYESAVTFYQTAQAIYIRLELPGQADGINGKIAAAKAGMEAEAARKAEEEAAAAAAAQEEQTQEGQTEAAAPPPQVQSYGPGSSVELVAPAP